LAGVGVSHAEYMSQVFCCLFRIVEVSQDEESSRLRDRAVLQSDAFEIESDVPLQ
jgi:hypothetical protein